MRIELNTGLTIYVSTYNFVNLNLESVSKEVAAGIVCIQSVSNGSECVEINGQEFYNKTSIVNWNEL